MGDLLLVAVFPAMGADQPPQGAFLLPRNHHSKSGPVKIIQRLPPEPATPAQEHARLLHKLALLEDRIADNRSWKNNGNKYRASDLERLLQQRESTLFALSQIRGALEEAIIHNPVGPRSGTPIAQRP